MKRSRTRSDEQFVPTVLFYNVERWKKLSIGSYSVGPMGLLALNDEQTCSPAVETFTRRGQLRKVADLDGNVIHHGQFLLRMFEQNGSRGPIVVSRMYAYGDVLLAATVFDVLNGRYPDNEIVFHTLGCMEPLVRYHPGVTIITGNETLKKVLRIAGVFLDLDDVPEKFEEKQPGAGLNRIEIFCQYLGLAPKSLCPSYYMDEADSNIHEKYLERFNRPFVGISPSTMRKEKSWRPERWRNLASRMTEDSEGTVFVFDKEDILGLKHERIVPVIGKNLRTANALAMHMDVMVTQDSLWSHLSAALGIPQILLASCTDGALLSKGYPSTTVIQRDWPCSPCWYRMKSGGCTYGDYPRCLDDVNVEEVFAMVMEALDNA